MRCELFEKYAAFAGDTNEIRLAGHVVHATQIDLARWQNRNFDSTDDRDLVLGIAEEVGEVWCALKVDDERDALGDVAIYLGQLLLRNRLSIEGLFSTRPRLSVPRLNASEEVGDLARCILKRRQKIRGYDSDDFYRESLQRFAGNLLRCLGVTVDDYLDTARIVLARDWKQFPTNGRDT